MRHSQDLHTNSIQKKSRAMQHKLYHDPALCGIARDYDPALCGIAWDPHIFVNFSANSKLNSKIF
jgi:hypothetical protein